MNPPEIELTRPETHSRIVNIVTASLESEEIDYETEHWLDDESRVDIFYDGIVVEVKSSTGVIDDAKLRRYEAHEDVREVVLCMPEPHAERVETGDRRVLTVPRDKFTVLF
ncbi:hypothetical protein [Halolamina salifodinae]|uniref:Uncharacterized protein n=1 Tax=Halolamina salifodinae TaxID=1202767 RepID=A0A8T4GSM5_9EURY|nr:hypothetical protein [Halolamina salifodinae]MBP1985856.1 hypothetical protein [Halolamina salifodinae]